ncbi:MAG: YidC/Oxa1 family membrane protein insertase [Candidatus Geothermincolia bacterium]
MHFAAIPLLGPISDFFAKILQFFNSFTGSFGWNVILLTIAFRVVVLPLSIKQTKSMIAMQRLQPQLKEIQKKYKDDREKQGQEMMKLYKDNKVSPLGGCLPLILQLPILFALFEVLRNAPKYVHYQTSFSFMGISNLIAEGSKLWTGGVVKMYNVDLHKVVPVKVPGGEYAAVVILILLTIVTGYISSKMMTNDPKQAKMMALMPVIFGVFAWILPAGVTIYIVTTNILMMLQQYVQLEAEGFYDEKRAIRLKTGEPFKWHERWRYKGYDVGSRVLTALHIKKRPKPDDAKQAAAGAKAIPAKGVTQGKPPAAKAGKAPAGKKPAGKKAAGKPSTGKPGAQEQKKSAKPQQGKKPAPKPEEKPPAADSEQESEVTWGHEPEGQSLAAEKETKETSADTSKEKPLVKKVDKSKQYPAKKKK